jgi:Spy/CpxP family protein refolding chaperone
MKSPALFFAGALLLPAGVAFTAVAQSAGPQHAGARLSSMTMAQKHQEQQYFTNHSFEFSSLFKRYHPGPYWILAKSSEFKLTAAQTRQQETLKNAMAKDTIKANIALKQAYAKYATDAKLAAPSLDTLRQDIDAIGHAQTRLAQVMLPYHLDSYAALTPTQQAVYNKLVAQQSSAHQP